MRWIAMLCCFMLASVVSANDLKIGTVDMQKLFNSYPGTQKAKDKLVAWEKKKQEELAPEKQELEDLQNDLTSSSSVYSAKEKALKKKQFGDKYAAYQQEAQQFEKEEVAKEAEMTQSIVGDIKDIVGSVAKDKGIDLVLDQDKTIYAKNAVDLTAEVSQHFKSADKDDDSK
ncbi:MAG TPA: OmpH family outer membrane protein [bacterium]|nr:OmpH family outer membrane protein [bacterium]